MKNSGSEAVNNVSVQSKGKKKHFVYIFIGSCVYKMAGVEVSVHAVYKVMSKAFNATDNS